METLKVEVVVAKEAYELGVCLKEIALALKAKKNVLEILTTEFAALQKAVEGIDKIPAEMKADAAAFGMALLLPLEQAVVEMVK